MSNQDSKQKATVLQPKRVIRTDYTDPAVPNNIQWLVTQTKALDEEHGIPANVITEGQVMTFQCRVHDPYLARLVMLPIREAAAGKEAVFGLSIPGFDVEQAVESRIVDLIANNKDDKSIIRNWLKEKMAEADTLKEQDVIGALLSEVSD